MKLTQLILMIFFSTILLSAQPEGRGRMKDELKLNDQQKDKIETIKMDHQKRMIDLRANLQKNHLEVRALEKKGNYSRNDYLVVVDKVTKVKNDIAKERANHRMDIYEQLNDEQKKIFNSRPMRGKGDVMGHKGKHHKGQGMDDHRGMRDGKGMGDGKGMEKD